MVINLKEKRMGAERKNRIEETIKVETELKNKSFYLYKELLDVDRHTATRWAVIASAIAVTRKLEHNLVALEELGNSILDVYHKYEKE